MRPKYPEYVGFGSEFHAKQDELFKSRKFVKFGINFKQIYHNLYLQNDEFSGVLDMLMQCDNEVIAIEFKDQKSLSLSKGAKMQLIAYSKLASSHFGLPFSRVILCAGNNLKFRFFDITADDLAEFDRVITQIKTLLKNENFPSSSASAAACEQCEFKNFCDDRE